MRQFIFFNLLTFFVSTYSFAAASKTLSEAPKVLLVCRILETSTKIKTPTVLINFIFESPVEVTSESQRASLLHISSWLPDDRDVDIDQIDEGGNSHSSWIPSFMEFKSSKIRNYLMQISRSNKNDFPKPVARFPVINVVNKSMNLGVTGPNNEVWTLECKDFTK